MQAMSRLTSMEAGAMMAPRWRDVRQGPIPDSAGSHRLAPWSGLGGWLRLVLHVIAKGARTLGMNLLVEVCALMDRLGRIAAVGGVILGVVATWQGQWVTAAWSGLVAIGGMMVVGTMSWLLPD